MKTVRLIGILILASTFCPVWSVAAGTNSISAGIPEVGSISVIGEEDVYEFTASAGTRITAVMSEEPSLMEPWIGLYDPNGNEIATATAGISAGLWNITLTNAGTYQILCRDDGGNETGSYSLTYVEVAGTNLVDAGETNSILPGIPATGTISQNSDLDVYEFTASAGTRITAVMSEEPSLMEPWIGLYDPDGNEIATATAGISAGLWNITLTNAGTYQILCRDDGGNETGSYSLTYVEVAGTNLVDAGETNSILPGIPATGTISQNSDLDVYEFTASAGTRITAVMSEEPSLMEPWIGLYDPDGNEIATATAGISAGLWNITLTNAGTYQILCRDDGGNETDSYSLTYVEVAGTNLVDAGETNSILPGIPATGTISQNSDLDVYTFEAIAGDALTIVMIEEPSLMEPWIGLYYPDGTLLQSDSGASEATVGSEFVYQTGTYYVLARDSGGDDTGSYTISLISQIPGPPPSGSPPEYLQIFTYSNNIMVRWPVDAIEFELEYNDSSLTNLPAAWSNVPPPYTEIGGYYFVTNPVSAAEENFFRLRK